MAKLRTDYQDLAWDGNKKYRMINNADGTISLTDVTTYLNKPQSEYNSVHVNTLNTTVNDSVNRVLNSDGAGSGKILVKLNDGSTETLTVSPGVKDIPTYGLVSTSSDGLAPKLDGKSDSYLRGNGTWGTVPSYALATTSAAGLMPKLNNKVRSYLNGTGGWSDPLNWSVADEVNEADDSAAREPMFNPDKEANPYEYPTSAKIVLIVFYFEGDNVSNVDTTLMLENRNYTNTMVASYYRSASYYGCFGIKIRNAETSGNRQVVPVYSWTKVCNGGTVHTPDEINVSFSYRVTYL